MDEGLDWEKRIEFGTRTCDALITGFDHEFPLHTLGGELFYIPSTSCVFDCLDYALGKICGFDKKRVSKRHRIFWNDYKSLDMNERVVEGLKFVTRCDGGERSALGWYFCEGSGENMFERHWFFGKGDLFRYRAGQRERAIEKVKAYWNPDELDDFRRIHEPMKEYVKRVYEEKER